MKIFDKKIIGLFIGLVFIALILKNIDLNKSIEAVKHLNLFYVVLIIPVSFCAFLFRSVRWKIILSEKQETGLISCLNAVFRGWVVNCVIPARGGELYRAHYFGKKENISRATVLASIVLERVLDGLILFLFLFFLTAFVYSSKKFFGVAVAAGILFVGTFLGLLLISKSYKNTFFQEKFLNFTNNPKSFLNKLFNKINSFMSGFDVFNSPVLVLKSFFFTTLVWLCEGLALFLLIKGFGHSIGFLGAMFVLSIIAFVSLIPGGPAGLGPVQWGFILALGFFKIPQETAFAVSIISQLFLIIFVSFGSLFFIIAERLNLKEEKYLSTEN